MRLTTLSRALVPPAVCAALAFTAIGPAAALTSAPEPAPAAAEYQAPIPDAAALGKQVDTLQGISGVLTPVTEFLDAVLAADDGQLPAAEATKHAEAIKKVLTPPTTPAPPALPGPDAVDTADRAAPPDLIADALAALQKQIDAILKAVTSGSPTDVAASLLSVVTGLVNVVVSTVLGGDLPAANLPGLPKLPAPPAAGLPATPTLP